MDDQFLHRLRREPPAAFAARLKWQLERPAPARRWRSRLLLGLAICGTAFALVSPPGRRALSDWLATPSQSGPQSAPSERSVPGASSAARSADTSGGSFTSPRGAPPRSGAPQFAVPAAEVPAPQAAVQPDADRNEAPSRVVAPFTPAAIVAAPPQTPEMKAAFAVSLRRGLFMNVSFVFGPMSAMLRQGAPMDFKVVRKDAIRLQTLASMIPEIFQEDTRPYEVNSRAQESIWAQPKEFEAKADELIIASDQLVTAAESDDDVAAAKAFGRVAAACQGCHDAFRK